MLRRSPFLVLILSLGCSTPAPVAPPPAPTAPSSLCGEGADGSPIVARAGDVLVSLAELEAAILRLPARARGRYVDLAPRRILAQRLVEERLLCRAADAAGLDASLVAQRAAEEAVASLYVDQAESAALSEEAVAAFYASNEARYELAVVDASHIVVADRDRAEALLREIRAGADFASLAIGNSIEPRSGERGGAVGWVSRGRMDPAWTDAAFALEPGTVSEPVRSQYGWHLIQVHARRSSQPLEEVRPGIERKLRTQAAEALVRGVVEAAPIQLTGPLLDGPAPGPDDPTP